MTLTLTTDLARAVALAAEAHDGQPRKRPGDDTGPAYLFHPLAVAALVIEHGGTTAQAIAAVLHDVVEDGGAKYLDRIRADFGDEVTAMVEGLSDAMPKEGQKKERWQDRKTAYFDELEATAAARPPHLLVSLADKTHNAESIVADLADPAIGTAIFGAFKGKRTGTAWYYARMARLYDATDIAPRLEARLVAAATAIAGAAGFASLGDALDFNGTPEA